MGRGEPGPPAFARADLLVIATLLATAVVLCLPIASDGWLTYLDNPAHLAEVHSLASDGASGWSRIGFAGLAIDSLHAPVLWRGLAALDRLGLDVVPVYVALVVLSLAAPALATFAVARRRLPRPMAAALAYLLLVQRPALVGTGSATGGMWTFYLACGALILLADRLARPRTDRRQVAAMAALLGFIGLTHLFVLVAAALLFAVHAAVTGLTHRPRFAADPTAPALGALVRRDAIAGALGAVAAAMYWLPGFAGTADLPSTPQDLALDQLGALLVWPTDIITLRSAAPGPPVLAGYLELLPIVLVLALGVAGAARIRRRDADPIAAYGAGLFAVIAILLVCATQRHLDLLGPVSWRFLYFLRVGAVLAALPACAALARRLPALAPRPGRALAGGAAAVAIASGLLWGLPLRRHVPAADSAEMAEVRALWAWLRANIDPDAGRVFVQDTFGAEPYDRALVTSHVLALTLRETGVEPLGPFYGIIPAATSEFVKSEFGLMFGGRLLFMRDKTKVLNAPIGSWGVQAVVTATPEAARVFAEYHWRELATLGRFVVFTTEPPHRAPLGVIHGRNLVVELDGDATIAHSYHRAWRIVRGPPGARITRTVSGRMAIAGLPPGHHVLVLAYRPPPWWAASAIGWLAIALVAYRRRPRAAAPGVASSHG